MKYSSKSSLIALGFILGGLMLFGCEAPEVDEPAETTSPLNTPEWAHNATIYEVNTRQYTEEGTFEAFSEHIPRLKEMGIDILWFMPIHPIGEEGRKGDVIGEEQPEGEILGSYYSIKDFFGVNPEFGGDEDFQAVVDKAHEHDMYVILDLVANHTSWDNYLIEERPDLYATDVDGEFHHPPDTDWDDVVQLDFDNPDTREYMKEVMEYWVAEFNIDGYRADVADRVPTDFWNAARERLDDIKPVFMLAEAETPEHHEAAFDMSYAWELMHAKNNLGQGEITAEEYRQIYDDNFDRFPDYAYRMQMTSNHDENSWDASAVQRFGDGTKAMAVLKSTIEGMPLVYNGQEVGFDRQLEFFYKDLIDWDFDSPFLDFYTTLLHLNRDNQALHNGLHGGDLEWITTNHEDQVIAFTREKDGDKIFTVINVSEEELEVELNSERMAGSYTEVFSGDSESFTATETLELEPWGYFVYEGS